jgi:hypothetical protein
MRPRIALATATALAALTLGLAVAPAQAVPNAAAQTMDRDPNAPTDPLLSGPNAERATRARRCASMGPAGDPDTVEASALAGAASEVTTEADGTTVYWGPVRTVAGPVEQVAAAALNHIDGIPGDPTTSNYTDTPQNRKYFGWGRAGVAHTAIGTCNDADDWAYRQRLGCKYTGTAGSGPFATACNYNLYLASLSVKSCDPAGGCVRTEPFGSRDWESGPWDGTTEYLFSGTTHRFILAGAWSLLSYSPIVEFRFLASSTSHITIDYGTCSSWVYALNHGLTGPASSGCTGRMIPDFA